VHERREVVVGKTPYVRFDRNDYSVPPDCVHRTLSVVATPEEVRILDGAEEVARHVRSYDAGAQIENPAHIEALVAAKRAARRHRGMDRLAHAAPSSRALLERLAERGANLGTSTARLLRLLDGYAAGITRFLTAANTRRAPSASSRPWPVRQVSGGPWRRDPCAGLRPRPSGRPRRGAGPTPV
jgi:hypothetical protein